MSKLPPQLTPVFNEETGERIPFTREKIIFADPIESEIKSQDGKGTGLKFHRIFLNTPYYNDEDEEIGAGSLIIPMDVCNSFGVSENHDPKTNELSGYSLSLSCWDLEGATPFQEAVTDAVQVIIDACIEHLSDEKTQEKLNRYGDDITGRLVSIKKKVLYWKEEKGKRVPGRGPTLYPKLMVTKGKDGTITGIKSRFNLMDKVDKEGNAIPLDPMKLIGIGGKARPCVSFQSIFVGGTIISLQMKLWEVDYDPKEGALKSLRKPSKKAVVFHGETDPARALLLGNAFSVAHPPANNDAKGTPKKEKETGKENTQPPAGKGELVNSDHEGDGQEEEEEEEKPKKKKTVVRRVVKGGTKKAEK